MKKSVVGIISGVILVLVIAFAVGVLLDKNLTGFVSRTVNGDSGWIKIEPKELCPVGAYAGLYKNEGGIEKHAEYLCEDKEKDCTIRSAGHEDEEYTCLGIGSHEADDTCCIEPISDPPCAENPKAGYKYECVSNGLLDTAKEKCRAAGGDNAEKEMKIKNENCEKKKDFCCHIPTSAVPPAPSPENSNSGEEARR